MTAAAGAVGLAGWKIGSDSSARPASTPVASPTGSPAVIPSAATATADVRQHGAAGDGATDDTAAFETALRQSPYLFVPPGRYVLTRTLVIPEGTRVVGGGKYNTHLVHAHNGDLAHLSAQCSLAELTLDGQGRKFSGRGLVISGSDGKQSLQGVAVVDFRDYCIDFETAEAGSQFRASQIDVARVDAATGTGRFAIHVAGQRQLASTPRSFIQLETQGQCAIDFGGSNDTYVTASTLGDLRFTPESRGVNITTSRLLNQTALTIDGHGITIVGCDIAPQLTLAPGADHVIVAPNSFNRLPVIDNSGNSRHQLPPDYSS